MRLTVIAHPAKALNAKASQKCQNKDGKTILLLEKKSEKCYIYSASLGQFFVEAPFDAINAIALTSTGSFSQY